MKKEFDLENHMVLFQESLHICADVNVWSTGKR